MIRENGGNIVTVFVRDHTWKFLDARTQEQLYIPFLHTVVTFKMTIAKALEQV